jgi:release factor glutamine methyltransferase
MQLKDALAQGIAVLEKDGIPSPRITAEVLLMHAARCDRSHLAAHPERELTDSEWVHYGRYLKERLAGKPTQYITGHQEFWGMDFLVNPSVLIPRPETELLVEAALDLARQHFSGSENLHIADVGTGSGCIAVALASELPQAGIYAFDSSPAALETARRNAQRLGVEARITFELSDLLQGVMNGAPKFEMVVSNPPYVAERDRPKLQREVREFEPREAVFAGELGRDVYTRLIPQAAQAMPSGGYLALELGYDSQEWVRSLLEAPDWAEVRWLPDLAGMVRVVTARRVHSPAKQSP